MLILDRTEALKRMLMVAPGPLHPPTTVCGSRERRRDVCGPWALTSSQLMMDARADVTAVRLEATLNPLLLQCACAECRTSIQKRIRAITLEWLGLKASGVKLTEILRPRMLIKWLANPTAHDIVHFLRYFNLMYSPKFSAVVSGRMRECRRTYGRQAPPYRRRPIFGKFRV